MQSGARRDCVYRIEDQADGVKVVSGLRVLHVHDDGFWLNGFVAATHTWERLKPYFGSPAVVPPSGGPPQELVNWELLKVSDE